MVIPNIPLNNNSILLGIDKKNVILGYIEFSFVFASFIENKIYFEWRKIGALPNV